jgi:hypothetical protein
MNTIKRKVGQPKKDDCRTHQLRIMLNNQEKELFLHAGFLKSHRLRKYLLTLIDAHNDKKNIIDRLMDNQTIKTH